MLIGVAVGVNIIVMWFEHTEGGKSGMNQRVAVPGSALSSIVDVYVIPRVLPAAKGAVARDSAVVRVQAATGGLRVWGQR